MSYIRATLVSVVRKQRPGPASQRGGSRYGPNRNAWTIDHQFLGQDGRTPSGLNRLKSGPAGTFGAGNTSELLERL